MYKTDEHIDMYFDIILKDLEEENIIKSWKELMSTSNVIPLDIQNYYISSNNYLTEVKTDQWKEEVHKLVLILSRIELDLDCLLVKYLYYKNMHHGFHRY